MSNAPAPTGIKAPLGKPWIEIAWSDGAEQRIPTAILRGYCPCAKCQGHSGPITFTPGHDDELRDLGQVGNYALRLTFGDGHDTGLYSFVYLRRLSELYAEHGDSLPSVLPELDGR